MKVIFTDDVNLGPVLEKRPVAISQKSRNFTGQGPVSRKSRELFGPEKPFVKLRPAFSGKLVFSYVVKGIKIKTAKFRASRLLRFEDTKRIMSPEIRPKSFGTFEKRAPACFSGLFPLPQFPLHLCNSEVLSNHTSQSS